MAIGADRPPKGARGRQTRAGATLVATALGRALLHRRIRALSMIVAGIAAVALTTAVLVVSFSVSDAIQGSRLATLDRADWAVVARSSSGIRLDLVDRIDRAVPSASVTPGLTVNTRLGDGSEDPILVVGATRGLAGFISAETLQQVDTLGPPTGREVYLSRSWASDRGLSVGDLLSLQTPAGNTAWRVGALVDTDFGNGGAVALASFPEVADAFDRAGVADLVFVGGPGDPDRYRARLLAAAGGAAAVVPPDQVNSSYTKSFASIQNLLNLLTLVVVLVAGSVVFFSWRLTIEEERSSLTRLRLLGVTRVHLLAAAAILVAPWLVVSMALGVPLGLLLGSQLSDFSVRLVELTQLAAEPGLPVWRPALGAFLNAQLMFGAATIIAVVLPARTPLVEGVTDRARERTERPLIIGVVTILVLLAVALLSLWLLPIRWRGIALIPLLLLIPATSRIVPRLLGTAISSRGGWTTLIAGRDLALGARRGAGFVAIFALAISMSLAIEAAARSIQDGIDRSVADWTLGQVFVQTAKSGANLADDKFAPEADQVLASTPGVGATAYFTYSTVELEGRRIPLWTWGSSSGWRGLGRFVDLEVVDGPSGQALWRNLDRAGVAVSSNYAYLHRIQVGDAITLPTRSGERRLRVAAVFEDLASDGGTLVVTPGEYRAVTGDRRHFQLIADLSPGANFAPVAARLRAELGDRYPGLVVWNRDGIRQSFEEINSQLLQSFRLLARILFLMALLVGATSIAASLAARRRSLALERLIGAPSRLLRRQIAGEYLSLGVCAWLIGFPIALVAAPALIWALALGTGLVPDLNFPWELALAALPLTGVVSGLALLLAGGLRGGGSSIGRDLAEE
ncbi:MAG TPA: FtsX-like permease family protein [Solirubrobacterales bacterium]|nr:FtsX-like permease family protein [Solirubrobacterales bacterium]